MKETGREIERHKDAERQEKGSCPQGLPGCLCVDIWHTAVLARCRWLKEFASRYKSGTNRLEFSADMWAPLNKTGKLVWRW